MKQTTLLQRNLRDVVRRALVLVVVLAVATRFVAVLRQPEPLPPSSPAVALSPKTTGSTDLDSVPGRIEAQARKAVADIHDLDPRDPRLNGPWVDQEVRGFMFARLLATMAADPTTLGTDDKAYYEWFQHIVRDVNVKLAEGAVDEYNDWKYYGCSYQPPTGPKVPAYDPGAGCTGEGVTLGTAAEPRHPTLEEFKAWGVARAAENLAVPDADGGEVASLLEWTGAVAGLVFTGVAIGFPIALTVGGVALADSSLAAIFGVEAAVGAATEYATLSAGLLFALSFAAMVLIVVAAIVIAVVSVIQMVEKSEFPKKLQENVEAARALPDLRALSKTNEGLLLILSAFALQLPPRPKAGLLTEDYKCVKDGISQSCPNPDTQKPADTGSGFDVQPFDTSGNATGAVTLVNHQTVKVPGDSPTTLYYDRGWLVKGKGSTFAPALYFDYFDWNGVPRRALVKKDKWYDGPLPVDSKSPNICKKESDCPLTDTLHVLDGNTNRLTLKTYINHPPPQVHIGAPDDTSSLVEGSTTKLTAEGVTNNRDVDGDRISYRWTVETGCAFTRADLDTIQTSAYPVGTKGECTNPSTYTASGDSVDVTWADSGTRLVKLEASDPAGLKTVTSRSFEIGNLAPELHIASTKTDAESVSITGCISDPAKQYEVPSLTVDWGDGTTPVSGPVSGVRLVGAKAPQGEPGTTSGIPTEVYAAQYEKIDAGVTLSFDEIEGCAGTYSFALTHTYTATAKHPRGSDTFPVTITASDGDGGTASTELRARGYRPIDVSISKARFELREPDVRKKVWFTVTFGEPTNGFGNDDLVFTGTAGVAEPPHVYPKNRNADGTFQSADVQADPLSDGTVMLTIPPGAAKAKDGRTTAASHPAYGASSAVTVDLTRPRATIGLAPGQLESARSSPVVFQLDFSERVQSVTLDDIDLSGTAQRGSATLLETRTGERFSLTVPVLSDGTIVASLRPDRVSDGFGNTAFAATSPTVHVDQTVPTVKVAQAPGQADPTTGSAVAFDVDFSEPVVGFDLDDLVVSGTAKVGSPSMTGSGASFRVTVPVLADGTVDLDVVVGAAFDAAGNLSGASSSTDRSVTVDRTPPGVLISRAPGQADPTKQRDVAFRALFSEPVRGFDANDLILSGGARHGAPRVTGSGPEYTVQVPATSGGTIALSVPAGAASDAAGNQSTASIAEDATIFVGIPPKLSISAHRKTRPFGAAGPKFTVTYKGFVNRDTPSVLKGTLTCTATATRTSSVGTYRITCVGLRSDAYEISYFAGRLVVVKAATALAVEPVSASVPKVTATLTFGAARSPAAGQKVSFKSGATVLCSAVTDTAGVASCTPSVTGLASAITNGVTARFPGSRNLLASTGKSGLFG